MCHYTNLPRIYQFFMFSLLFFLRFVAVFVGWTPLPPVNLYAWWIYPMIWPCMFYVFFAILIKWNQYWVNLSWTFRYTPWKDLTKAQRLVTFLLKHCWRTWGSGGNLHMLWYGDVPLSWVLFWGLLLDFWVPFWVIPGFLGIMFW